ncbi:hypothetical protein NLG97_g237 [Lecanicillium saksenae]|uniref:Uncharacterized protein n=1 Tax=Lecanicillium saksenae TaxID=468837 RepID=A0ACC1RAK3_9HYPO|nr:hypothetical protein NLG97_g237 [Lecanicillium saksenae]
MTAASLAPWQATICQLKPPLQIRAGSIVSSQLECSPDQNMHCEAVLQFKDHTFLPYVVDLAGNQRCSTDHTCVGEFIVPASVPNGPATLFWLCAGQMAPACVEAEIQAGNGDAAIPIINRDIDRIDLGHRFLGNLASHSNEPRANSDRQSQAAS